MLMIIEMEYCDQGNLDKYLKKNKLSFEAKLQIFS